MFVASINPRKTFKTNDQINTDLTDLTINKGDKHTHVWPMKISITCMDQNHT